MVTHLYGILGVILDRTFGNIIRMLRVIRLPKEERGHLSWTFVGTLAVILAYGLIMMFSASYSSGYTNHGGNIYYFIKPQAIVAAVGFVVMLGVSLINYRALRYMFWTFYVITLALLVLALFMPSDNNGCYRWVYLPGGMSLQPSELAKFAVILGTADILDHHQREIKSLFQCVFNLPTDTLLHDIFITSGDPGNHPEYVTIHCRLRDSVCKCADSPRRVIADSFQLQNFFIIIRKYAFMINHDLLCCLLHIPDTVIISKTFP